MPFRAASEETGSAHSDFLNALAEVLKAAGDHSEPDHAINLISPDGLRAIAALIGSIAWPALALFMILSFRPQLAEVVRGITEFDVFGVKGKIQRQLDQSAQAAENIDKLSQAPTPGEVARSIIVEKLTQSSDLALVRQQVDELALEYERIRSSMPSGDTRTRRMEVVVAQMRTLGRAVYAFRHELAASPSPGKRLQAIASLQVVPDFEDLLLWLAERISTERPFVAYHALVALNVAAADARALDYVPALQQALARAQEQTETLSNDSDRKFQLKEFQHRIQRLTAGA
jgi:hypothetical protein